IVIEPLADLTIPPLTGVATELEFATEEAFTYPTPVFPFGKNGEDRTGCGLRPPNRGGGDPILARWETCSNEFILALRFKSTWESPPPDFAGVIDADVVGVPTIGVGEATRNGRLLANGGGETI